MTVVEFNHYSVMLHETIEQLNINPDGIYVDDGNGWTIYTEDGKPSAQWEIMVLVTEDGHEVLSW